jgi:hypothetical protein
MVAKSRYFVVSDHGTAGMRSNFSYFVRLKIGECHFELVLQEKSHPPTLSAVVGPGNPKEVPAIKPL